MKRLYRSLLSAVALIFLSSCIFEGHNEKLTGRYRLTTADDDLKMHVGYELKNGHTIGRIQETVFSVGWNERYIVAKQHPKNDRAITNHFYLEMALDSEYAEPSVSVKGPFSATEFEKEQTELGLPAFSLTIEHLK